MKFSHTLSLNSNPEWGSKYLDYAGLKKVINELASQQETQKRREQDYPPGDDAEQQRLRARTVFLAKLEKQIASIREFYYEKRNELDLTFAHLKSTLQTDESYSSTGPRPDSSSLENTTAPEAPSVQLSELRADGPTETSPLLLNSSNTTHVNLEDARREICDLFTQYHSLKTYASLNCEAVRKILKKYDKIQNDNLKETHLVHLQSQLPFWDVGTPEIGDSMDTLTEYFAALFCQGDSNEALRRLKLMVREFVTFQRHSVWLDVVEDQRKQGGAIVQTTSEVQLSEMGRAAERPPSAQKQGEDDAFTKKSQKKRPRSLARIIQSSHTVQLGLFCVAVFFSLLYIPGIFDNYPAKRNALAMFVFVSLLWACEVFPLFVTSMLVPFLTVVLRVLLDEETGRRLDAMEASEIVFESMFSHVIMLLVGGFSLAAALSKHNIAKIAASYIALRSGSGTRVVLLVNQLIATVVSMWISNVAAPVLCYSLISPILKAASAEQSRVAFGTDQYLSAEQDRRLCRALVMGIALASDVGGMASPISSPQNLFAIEYTPIGWVPWFIVSIPLCLALNLIIWAWLVVCFRLPSCSSAAVAYALKRESSSGSTSEALSIEQYFVIFVSVGVMLLWCASVVMSDLTGQMGVLGIVPFVLFFGTGILTKEDLNSFLWPVVILAMGGLVLGEAIMRSGLIDDIAREIAQFVEYHSLSLWATLCIFTSLILFCTTFVSHTVGAIVVLPIAYAVGMNLELNKDPDDETTGHAKVLVFSGALACSAAMGLPVSGFPNMTAAGVEDNLGNRFLTTIDFIKFAVPASVFSWFVIVSGGYALIRLALQVDQVV